MQWKDNWSRYIIDWNSSTSSIPHDSCFYDRHDSESYCYRYTTIEKQNNLQLFRGHSSIRFDSGPELNPSAVAVIDDRIYPVYSLSGTISGWKVETSTSQNVEHYRLDGKLDHIVDHTPMGLDAGRIACAGIAKVGVTTAINGAAAMAFRNGLKRVMRGPFAGSNYRIESHGELMRKYGSDAAIQSAAGRTNPGFNVIGAILAIGGSLGAACECP